MFEGERTICHNLRPESRLELAFLDKRDIVPKIVLYLHQPTAAAQLGRICNMAPSEAD